jgi:UDP-N-acetylmuramyl pentapeptide phosphotransferase/UDP-N-acetylglucosamine-1-phosphate transferase
MTINAIFSDPIYGALVCAAVSLCASATILWTLLGTGLAWRLAMDMPNDRSLHTRPTPRVGGWGVVPTAVVVIWIAAPVFWMPVLAAVFLAMLSQIDDRRGLPARVRFGGHVIAVAALILLYPASAAWWILVVIAVLLVWLVNLYNFMDGADGLAGGMALFGFGGYALAAITSAQPSQSLAIACATLAGAAGGFLFFNFHPAKVFLGDAGSIPLGFFAGARGYLWWRNGVWPIWFPAVTFSPFIGDASVTLCKRLMRGEKFWQAHRDHYYQRMVRSGMGHGQTARIWYLIMAIGMILAVCLLRCSMTIQWCVVAGWIGVLCLMAVAVDRQWRRFQSTLIGQSHEVRR